MARKPPAQLDREIAEALARGKRAHATVNPGSGSVTNATSENADRNIAAFVRDLKLSDVEIDAAGYDEKDGQGSYQLTHKVRPRRRLFARSRNLPPVTKRVEVLMPGLPLKRVRYMGQDQNPFDFPRLYVNDSSWLWKYAVDSARDTLSGKYDDD